jgi:hypothetical protein
MSQIFSTDFDPILLPNETATLFGAAFPTEGQPVKSRWVGSLPEYTKNFGALTAGVWATAQEDSNLELGSLELGQMRCRVIDDILLRMNNPTSTEQWRTNKTRFHISKFSLEDGENFLSKMLWRMSEFFVWENNTPRFDLYSTPTATVSKVVFSGWRIKVEKIAKAELTSKAEIWVNGWPSGK